MYSVYDIETLKGLFLYVSKNLASGKISIFRIDKYQNDLYALVKHLRDGDDTEYLVSYNGLSFDAQVIQFILDNFEDWAYFSNSKIVRIIYQFAQDLIDDLRYNLWPPYRENRLWKKQVDLFRIHHFDGKTRRTSLKWLEYAMNLDSIEEMPIDHHRDVLTEEDIQLIIRYCIHDVEATCRLFWITRGQTELELYAGKDKIQDRFDLMAEFGLPPEAMNWSDVKIGSELNKRGYAKEAGIPLEKVYERKLKRKSNAGFTYGDCIPAYVTFKTPRLQAFLDNIRGVRVNLKKVKKEDEQEFPIEINGTLYKIKRGGIHSNEEKRIVVPGNGELLIDADVGSQYPNSIVKRGLYPSHLGPQWLVNYKKTIQLRLLYKNRSKDLNRTDNERRKYAGLAEMLKLALNGGGFGRTNMPEDWQYDPKVHFSCTIGNQFEILMLIEELELAGIHCISANTDGIVCLLSTELEQQYFQICSAWEQKVGNHESGKLEYTYYNKLIQTSVNSYLAIKADSSIKRKDDFVLNKELHANSSRRIITIAVENYFLHGIPVAQTIQEHTHIFDFCIGVKTSSDYHFESVNPKTGEKHPHHRIVRYYVSNAGSKLLKIKNPGSQKKGPAISQCEAGTWLSTICNVLEETPISARDLNYNYYICKAEEFIRGLEGPTTKKGKKIYNAPSQLSMF